MLELPPGEIVLGKDGEADISFGYSTTMGYGKDRRFVQYTNTIRATVERRVDGIPFNDPHSVQVIVREGGQLQSVSSHWPRVKTGKELRPPTSDDLVAFVRTGQARGRIIPGPRLKVVQATEIRRFTIERVSFTWVVSLSPFKAESSGPRYLPMATVSGLVDLEDGKQFRTTVLCPASVDLPVPAIKSEEKVPAYTP